MTVRILALFLALCASLANASVDHTRPPYEAWTNSFPTNADFFPVAVWLQNPRNAARYKAAGINTYVGLWNGPTAAQITDLQKAGMHVVCQQNTYALSNLDNRTIVAWMHDDEPDNAQSLGRGKGYGPPVKPEVIVRDYEQIKASDPSRPVLLNVGQAVAWDNYIGRGVRRNHPEDYPAYIKGCDIVSFDIYPAVHDHPSISNRLEFVAYGVERLVKWSNGDKVVWNCIECTHIGEPNRKATPDQVRSEVWMSLISGSRGLIYFVHQFKPAFNEAALLADAPMLAAVTEINRQIHELAPVLNSPSLTNVVQLNAPGSTAPRIVTMAKRLKGDTYVFAASLTNVSAQATFTIAGAGTAAAEVLGEKRTVLVHDSTLKDEFKPYAVHLYKIAEGKAP